MSEELAYFKYTGKDVESGYLDARKTADTLIAIDQLVRYFLFQKETELNEINFEIPVRIEKGSWIAWLPSDINEWLQLGGTAAVGNYLIQATKELAKNDVGDKGLKDVFKWTVKGIKWIIVLSMHLGKVAIKQIRDGKYKENEDLQLIGVPDKNGDILWVPKEYVELYTNMPAKLLSEMVKHISDNRNLEIDFSDTEKGDKDDYSNAAVINLSSKSIFRKEIDLNDTLFPELVHGKYVELDGRLSRGNEYSNTFGFKYKDHILTIVPRDGQIIIYKNLLFSDCKVRGYVNRIDKNGNYKAFKPRIMYEDIIDIDNKEKDLFG